ncbi:MAG: hypothetical protein ACYDBJ_26685 [Aggregatilineales bacterium]
MEPIRLTGRVNEKGQIEIHQTEKLPPGDIVILIEPISAEIAADEALWDEQFARSQDVLEELGRETLAEYEAGLTDDFDPDSDPL